MGVRSHVLRCLCCALGAAAAAGCMMVGPDYQEPAAPVAEQWTEAGDPSVDTSEQTYREWWAVFGDPVLNTLVERGYQQNYALQSAGLRVLEARAQLGIAIGEWYPQLQQGVGEVIRQRVSQTAPFTTPGSSKNFRYWQAILGAQMSWEVDFWGKFRRAIESADMAFLGSVTNYDAALVSLVGDVARTYVVLRTIESQLAIARANAEIQRQGLQIAQARFEFGAVSERDVSQAQTVLFSTEATIPDFERQIQQTKNALAVFLGLPPGSVDELLADSVGIPNAPPIVAVGIPADLIRRRPDIRLAELRAASQSAQIGVAKADLYPALSLTGNFGTLSSNWTEFQLSDLFKQKSIQYAFGPTLQWNILNYGQITNNVRFQDALFQQLVADYQNQVLVAQREVEDALIGFLDARRAAERQAKAAEAAKRSVELAFLQYQEGITDFTTVLTAQQDLLTAQNQLAVFLGDIPLNLVNVYQAMGGGWQLREGNDFVPPAVQQVMRQRTDWGNLLTPVNLLRPTAPGLPSPRDRGPLVRAPEF